MIIEGNLLAIERGLICHQVNCRYAAGAGLALHIRNRWPEWYRIFKATQPWLGMVTIYEVHDSLLIANLYAQHAYGQGKRYTNYAALGKCLMEVKRLSASRDVYLPYGIGCGLAGGDWNIVSQIISDALPNAILVRLPELR